jgi:polyphosphate kinase
MRQQYSLAGKLEEAGVHVVYGLVGYKIHAKMTLVVRKDEDLIRRYVHLGTGNYNPNTSKIYTDVSFFTSKVGIAEDVTICLICSRVFVSSKAPRADRRAV